MSELLAKCKQQLREFEDLNIKRNAVIERLESENQDLKHNKSMVSSTADPMLMKSNRYEPSTHNTSTNTNVSRQYDARHPLLLMPNNQDLKRNTFHRQKSSHTRLSAQPLNGTVIYHHSVNSQQTDRGIYHATNQSSQYEESCRYSSNNNQNHSLMDAGKSVEEEEEDEVVRKQNESRLMSMMKEEQRRLEE